MKTYIWSLEYEIMVAVAPTEDAALKLIKEEIEAERVRKVDSIMTSWVELGALDEYPERYNLERLEKETREDAEEMLRDMKLVAVMNPWEAKIVEYADE